jgi:hypothetical protein
MKKKIVSTINLTEQWYSPKMVSRMMPDVTPDDVCLWARKGFIAAQKKGRCWRIHRQTALSLARNGRPV